MATYEQKQSYLDILAVFHYVMGGISALMCLAALAFLGIGMGAATEWGRGGDLEPGCAIGAVMFFALLVLGGYALLNLVAGRALHQRRNRTLVFVAAAFNCLNMPLGTLLAIFTFVLLADPQLAWQFRHGGTAPPPTDPVRYDAYGRPLYGEDYGEARYGEARYGEARYEEARYGEAGYRDRGHGYGETAPAADDWADTAPRGEGPRRDDEP